MRYRKIDPRIWNDERFRALTDDGKLVFLFLLTHPSMTALGAMRATIPGLAAELGWPIRRFRDAILPAAQSGMVEVDEGASFVGLPKFLRYNEPESPNSVKSWIAALDLIPECDAKRGLVERSRNYLEGRSEDFKNALGEGIWKGFRQANRQAFSEGNGDPGSRRQEAGTRRRKQQQNAGAESTTDAAADAADDW
jgi:hypothetical protein